MNSYKDLVVWQKSIELAKKIYRLTSTFPRSDLYGLISQMRRAAVSIASNIAEGYFRGHRSEYLQFLKIALGSAAELETQLIISKELGYITQKDFTEVEEILTEVMKMLQALHKSLRP